VSERPTRRTAGGRAYLDLQNLARRTSRPTDEVHQLYALEGFLDRLTRSAYADRFVLKGAVLLAALALRQRCLIHRARNILAKIPAHAQAEVKAAYWAVFDTNGLDTPPGPDLVRLVQTRIDRFAEHYRAAYPAAVRCLLADREQLTAYLRFPVEHYRRIRHSNFIERTFGETGRRVKVIGRLPGEAGCRSLAWAVLDRASHGWRGFIMTASGLRRALLDPHTCAQRHRASPSQRTPKLSAPSPNLPMS